MLLLTELIELGSKLPPLPLPLPLLLEEPPEELPVPDGMDMPLDEELLDPPDELPIEKGIEPLEEPLLLPPLVIPVIEGIMLCEPPELLPLDEPPLPLPAADILCDSEDPPGTGLCVID